jgi:hypothetical protein
VSRAVAAHKPVRLDDLSPAQRQLILALIAARDTKATPAVEVPGAASAEVGHEHRTRAS